MTRPSRRGWLDPLRESEWSDGTDNGSDGIDWDTGTSDDVPNLTVAEGDGAPSVSGVDGIIFDEDDFTVTDNADGTVTVESLAAGGPGGSGDGLVPFFVPTGDTWTIVENQQALWTEDIVVDGTFTIAGHLIDLGDVPFGGGAELVVKDEGSPLATAAGSIDFVGAGVTATGTGADKTVTIPGGASDVVNVASGAGSVTIPGIDVPDRVPTSPSAYDDEFNTTDASSPFAGWTTLGSFDVANTNVDFASHLHIKRTGVGSVECNGIYKAAPSLPFTCTIKLADWIAEIQYASLGILLTETSPGKLATFDIAIAAGNQYFAMRRWTNRTTFATSVDLLFSAVAPGMHAIKYLRIVATSSTSIQVFWSYNGLVWHTNATLTGINPSLTIANVGISLGIPVGSSPIVEAAVDWIRFT